MTIEIADRLLAYRKKANLSQEQLAEKLGVSRQAVSKWERAEASPDTDNLINLAALYDVTLDDLLHTDPPEDNDTDGEPETSDETADEASDSASNGFTIKDGKSSVSIGSDGIHVRDGEDDVKINFSGVHVRHGEKIENGKSKVFVNGEPVEPDENGNIFIGGKKFPFHQEDRVPRFLNEGMIALLAVLAYLVMGFAWNLWHPGWIVFLLIPLIPSIYRAIKARNPDLFLYPVLVTTVFLLCGCVWNLWHPMWVLFITIPIYYMIIPKKN